MSSFGICVQESGIKVAWQLLQDNSKKCKGIRSAKCNSSAEKPCVMSLGRQNNKLTRKSDWQYSLLQNQTCYACTDKAVQKKNKSHRLIEAEYSSWCPLGSLCCLPKGLVSFVSPLNVFILHISIACFEICFDRLFQKAHCHRVQLWRAVIYPLSMSVWDMSIWFALKKKSKSGENTGHINISRMSSECTHLLYVVWSHYLCAA